MGGKNSKQQQQRSLWLWSKLREAPEIRYDMLSDPLIGQSSSIQEECAKSLSDGLIKQGDSSRTEEGIKLRHPGKQPSWYDDDEEEVGFPVRPRVPLRTMTYKMAVDLSHFLKEKGGLEGIYYSERRKKILDLYALNEWGIVDGWQNYTDGPGERYPKTFGFCFKLVPVHPSDEAQNDEHHCLLHPMQVAWEDDPWKEILVWKFDPFLAVDYAAWRLHPEQVPSTSA
uniref:Protein Nef n=1 Tax=Simian immunodeficiency virus - agm.Sab92018 TaxID=1081704 RepID=A0A2P1DSV9_SIVSA|nr:nef protein [Simian immunodeficiency virus - agm.Sab92018]